jgi:NADH dehydrogenase
MKHVVIVGGGFAGFHCARKLSSHRDVRITLIDKNNYQQFQPLLYQVAAGFLSPSSVGFSLRNMLVPHPSVEVKLDEVVSADLNTRTVTTSHGMSYEGDYLVLAAGSQANFFGTPGAEQHAYPLYSLHDAELLRSRILAVLEAADRDTSLIEKGALNFVLVGAGATGTELAGILGDMMQNPLKLEFPNVPFEQAGIHLVDMGHSVLSAFSPKAQNYAADKLAERGVTLHLGRAVKEIGPGHVLLSDGTRIQTHTVVWAGGLRASNLSGNLGIRAGHGGRVDVQPDFTVEGLPRVYALGDFANIRGNDGKPLPQLASVAEQAGKWCAKNIAADIEGAPRKPFEYLDKGIMAMIGRKAAVAEVGPHRHDLQGAIAFAAWLGVHAALLTSTRAKMETFVDWAWDYFSKVRADEMLDRFHEEEIDWNADLPSEKAPANSANPS